MSYLVKTKLENNKSKNNIYLGTWCFSKPCFENLDSYHFFQSSDLNNSKIVSVSESLVESISGFSENDTITISAVIYDVPGNMTIGSDH